MAAVPKKKPSQTRKHKRHSAWQASYKPVAKVACKNCGKAKIPHRVCSNCGQYRGRQIGETETKVRKVSGDK